jgi:DNA-binding GntR family transcriptional regulator
MNLFDVMSTARSLPVWGSLKRRTSTPERRKAYHEHHTAIVAALTERDPEHAQALMRDHLRHVSDDMLGRH